MNMAPRTFYVLYVPDGLLADCIDAIRVLAQPSEKYRAHITVRGPYQRSSNRSDRANRAIENSEITIDGCGNFFESGQNTVYLRCSSPNLETAWHKPDYGFNPHITLYDGSSREFAEQIWDVASRRTYDMSFVAGPLKPLVSSKKHQGGMALQADLNPNFLRGVAGIDIGGGTVESLEPDVRLQAIGSLCDFLSTIGPRLDTPRWHGPISGATNIEVKEVEIASKALSSVKALAKKNSATLGFLPEGAFDAYAKRGWVLAAIVDGQVVGYVIYRVSRMTAVLVHLCTDEKHRGKGIATQLFRNVVGRTEDLHGVVANTRRDFPAHNLWPRLGFAAVGERPGRGRKPSVLTRWWYEHTHPTLFSNQMSYAGAQSPIDVAIDLNVFYDLVMPSSRAEAEESRSLQSDWLTDEIQLCVTAELFNEITRLSSTKTREGQRTLAHDFKRISGRADAFDRSYALLSSIMGEAKNERQSSDLRHLAHTAAADVDFFVTRDAPMIKFREDIERETGVAVMRPLDLVMEIDQVRNTASYQPVRLRGSSLQISKVYRQQREQLEDIFVNKSLGERKTAFRQKFTAILPSHPTSESAVVQDDGEPIALFGFDRSDVRVLKVPCLRVRRGRLARTLARQIVMMAIDSSLEHTHPITTVTDDCLDPYVEEALAEGGFVKDGSRWIKLNYPGMGTVEDVAVKLEHLLEQLRDSGLELPGTRPLSMQLERELTAAKIVQIERSLRPLKITNEALNTLVIPIKPRWAQHLFDSDLADQTLFGARSDLVLNGENAYYRSPRSLGSITAPFRILWYVSQDSRYVGTRQIRAYSVASGVEVLPARVAYNRYKRLGVYDRQQVVRVAGGDPGGPVMVIPFCDTEIFKNPIDGDRFGELLESLDQRKPLLRGPQQISGKAFAEIYSEGQYS